MDAEKEKRFRFQMQLEQDEAGQSTQAQAKIPESMSVGGFASNVVGNLGRAINPLNIAKGFGEQVYEGAYALPRDIAKSTVQMAQGTPYAQTSIAQRATDISNTPQVQTPGKYAYENPIDAAMTVAAPVLPFLPEAALSGRTPLPGKAYFQEAAQEAGRKSLGFTKRFLNKPGAIENANQVAQTMLDQGVIRNPITHPLSSGAADMLERTGELKETSGQSVGNVISSLSGKGKTAFHGTDIANEIQSQLTPKYFGGAYDAEQKAVQEILNTVKAHGEGPIDFSSAQALKEKLQELGKFNSNTDAVKANLYRRASGIVRDALDKGVIVAGAEKDIPIVDPGTVSGNPQALFDYNDTFGPGGTERSLYTVFGDKKMLPAGNTTQPLSYFQERNIPISGRTPRSSKYTPLDPIGKTNPELSSLAKEYLKSKNLYGKSVQAEKALTNRLSSEEGNKNIGLTDTIAAGAELAAGSPMRALAVVGGKRALERSYHAAKATMANALSKTTINPLKQVALAAFIDKITTKNGGE